MDETVLEFREPSFTDIDLKALPNLEKVEMLTLVDTAVTDEGCRELLRARALVEIAIISDKISDNALGVLAQLPALRSLQIHRGPRIGDVGLRLLSDCIILRELYLKETAITDQGLSAIAKLPHVWSLILDDTAVSDEGCVALADMPHLSLLGLRRTRVMGHGVARLRDNQHFIVNLEDTSATDEAVTTIAERISNLKFISLNRTIVGDGAARALSKLQRLNEVRFSYTKLTDEGLAAFVGHPFLDAIYVEGCAVSKAAVSALKKARRNLTVYGP